MTSLITGRKNILVTGGAGFIGSHLVEDLVRKNNVICLDDFSSGTESNIDHLLSHPNFVFIRHDLTIPIDLNEQPELSRFKVKYQGVQEVYHLACPTSPNEIQKKRIETALANSHATANALAIALKYHAKFLHVSSSVVYGPRTDERQRVGEDDLGIVDVLSPRACYDEGKRFAETLVNTYRLVHNLDTKIIRLFRTYGPHLKLNDGHMLSDFIDAALDNREIVVYGDRNFSTSLCYISDVISALTSIMKSDYHSPYNVGGDAEILITDVAGEVIAITNSTSSVVFKEALEFTTPLVLPRLERVKKDIGWFPLVRLGEGLAKTVDYLRAQKGLLGVDRGYDNAREDNGSNPGL